MQAVKNIIGNFKRYSFLMSQLISRDFKVKYKRSVLGVLWSVLYPVFMMMVMAIVFSKMFRAGAPKGVSYLAYLETGLVLFQYFSDATTQAMTSVITNFSLMTKVYIPKYIFPLSKCLFAGINFLLTLIPLLAVIIFTGTISHISLWYLLLPIIFFFGLLFTIGISFILSTTSVFLRDILYIYGIIIMILNYVTPIFYDISIIPDKYLVLFKLNPLYVFINCTRDIILFGNCPSPVQLMQMVAYGLGSLLIGTIIFKKNQDKFVYYA